MPSYATASAGPCVSQPLRPPGAERVEKEDAPTLQPQSTSAIVLSSEPDPSPVLVPHIRQRSANLRLAELASKQVQAAAMQPIFEAKAMPSWSQRITPLDRAARIRAAVTTSSL